MNTEEELPTEPVLVGEWKHTPETSKGRLIWGGLFVLLVIVVICLAAFRNAPPTIVAVGLQDNRVLFGLLDGNSLCGYYEGQTQETKTGPHFVVVKGGAAYNGSGCVTINEKINWTEELYPNSNLYVQIRKMAGR